MGFASVRAAVNDYLQAGVTSEALVGIGTIFPQPPKITPEGDFVVASEDPGHSMGTVVYIYLGTPVSQRLGTGGPTSGIKWRKYEVSLIAFTRSASKLSQDCGDQADAYLDSLRAYIEANRTAGTAPGTGAVWQWGEGDHFGGDDIKQEATMPRLLRGKLGLTQVYSVTTVLAIETYYA